MSKDKPTAAERRCRPVLSDEDILFIYQNTKPSRRGRPQSGEQNPNSFFAMAKRFGIDWTDVQSIVRGYSFAEITGAAVTRSKEYLKQQFERAYTQAARDALSDEQVRMIRTKARLGPLSLDRAPFTYESLGARFKLPPKVIRAIKRKQLLAEVPDVAPEHAVPKQSPNDHWM